MQAIWQGEKLKVRRRQLGLTTAELAAKVGTEHSHISMWESNKAAPSGHFVILLGIALNDTAPKDFYIVEQ